MSCRLPRNISEPRLPPRSSVSPERDTLAAAIASLPPRYHSVLLLRYDCGYSNAEIANILDMTEPNVRKLIQRAKEKLSAALSGMEEP